MLSEVPRAHRARRIRTLRLLIAAMVAALGIPAVLVVLAIAPSNGPTDAAAQPAGVTIGAGTGSTDGTPLVDGGVPADATVYDDALPAVGNLDPALRDALRRAADAASADVAEFTVNSGWRSAAYQDRLLQDAVVAYGSAEEAARWVASASTSPHVSGDAVDVGMDAAAWLAASGAGFGLCRIYDNEAWHVELRPEAVGAGCPDMYGDPTYDPRMQ